MAILAWPYASWPRRSAPWWHPSRHQNAWLREKRGSSLRILADAWWRPGFGAGRASVNTVHGQYRSSAIRRRMARQYAQLGRGAMHVASMASRISCSGRKCRKYRISASMTGAHRMPVAWSQYALTDSRVLASSRAHTRGVVLLVLLVVATAGSSTGFIGDDTGNEDTFDARVGAKAAGVVTRIPPFFVLLLPGIVVLAYHDARRCDR